MLNAFASPKCSKKCQDNVQKPSSESCEIKCGVSQGSLLGPLLFLLYINDLCNVSKVVDFILFADDTNIFFSHKDFNLLPEILNSEMLKLTQWCRANKLSINFKKSNFMVFRPRQRRQTLDISIQIDSNVIERVKETVFLGVILDEHLVIEASHSQPFQKNIRINRYYL